MTTHRSKVAAIAALVLLSALLAACGGSSNSSSAGSTTSASTQPAGPPASGLPRTGRFTALRECLRKNGITLPERTPGRSGAPRGGFFGGPAGGPRLPKGVSRAKYEAALKKCGGAFRRGAPTGTPAFKTALTRFAACMRQHGIKLPEPNTSGSGPVFPTRGLSTTSPQFKAAEAACATSLRGALQGAPGAGGPAGVRRGI